MDGRDVDTGFIVLQWTADSPHSGKVPSWSPFIVEFACSAHVDAAFSLGTQTCAFSLWVLLMY